MPKRFRCCNETLRVNRHDSILLRQKRLLAIKAEQEKEALSLQVAELAPKAAYVDTVLQSNDLLATTIIAKEFGMSAVDFNRLLHAKGIQHQVQNVWVLYAKYQNKGYQQTKTYKFLHNDGSVGISTLMYWTQAGKKFLHEQLNPKLQVKAIANITDEFATWQRWEIENEIKKINY